MFSVLVGIKETKKARDEDSTEILHIDDDGSLHSDSPAKFLTSDHPEDELVNVEITTTSSKHKVNSKCSFPFYL